ncbi:large-conductance mechanosensitive channel protein MscL [Virgibacillus kekensis]|uniref:Large-conductance mechanosensitive channel n=1 Tax=Virgibacillus kekensis TaxID=202261 RepID=A0ABV9DKR8_9BACI
MWSDFKEFAMKGNVFELAVAVVIGTAFGKIVSSLVENIIMPVAGILGSGVDFTEMKYTVRDADILYGEFIQSIFDFLVIALSIFFFIRLMKKLHPENEEAEKKEKKPDKKEELLTEIRDLLKDKPVVMSKKKKVSIHIKGKRDENHE